MTQQAALYPGLSVEENVSFFAAIYGVEGGVKDALEFVDLYTRRGSVVATLSGGMRQRCSLACALVHRPRLLLLDEPTVGLERQLRREPWDAVAPLVILGLLGYMLRNSATPAVGVVNEDSGPLGAVVASALDGSTKITTTNIAASEGDAKLKDGSIVAYIVFPSDFTQGAQGGVI